MLRVLLKFSDRYNPAQEFYPGDIIIVEDKIRERELIEKGIVAEAIPFVLKTPEGLKKSDTNEVEDKEHSNSITNAENYKGMTIKELREILNEKGIEFDAKAKKEELINLLEG